MLLKHLHVPVELRLVLVILIPLDILRTERQRLLDQLCVFLNRLKPSVTSDKRNVVLTSFVFCVVCIVRTYSRNLCSFDGRQITVLSN